MYIANVNGIKTNEDKFKEIPLLTRVLYIRSVYLEDASAEVSTVVTAIKAT